VPEIPASHLFIVARMSPNVQAQRPPGRELDSQC
jgi:hypothetical protein